MKITLHFSPYKLNQRRHEMECNVNGIQTIDQLNVYVSDIRVSHGTHWIAIKVIADSILD